MVRLRAILLRQRELLAPIIVHKNKRFEEIMAAVNADVLEGGLEESFG
jgi:hypothetical protein